MNPHDRPVFHPYPSAQRARSWPETIYNGVVWGLAALVVVLIFCVLRTAMRQRGYQDPVATVWDWMPGWHNQSTPLERRQSSDTRGAKFKFEVTRIGHPRPSFYGPSRPAPDRTFCFVVGAEGTGSTWISKMLPADHRPPFNPNKGGLTAVVHRMWASGPTKAVRDAREQLVDALRQHIPPEARLSVLHVSAPDWDASHYPDLHSSLWSSFHQAGLALRVVVMLRDPSQAAHSNHRRRWKHLQVNGRQDVARSARFTEMHLTLLSEQVRTLRYPNDVLVVNYQSVLLEPNKQGQRLARYLGLDAGASHRLANRLVRSRRAPSNYTEALGESQVEYLQGFFDTERCAKWQFLHHQALVDPIRPDSL